jgi:hypothetical protein
MQDDGGDVLGNLPRSRPGRRSDKRTKAGKGTSNRPAAAAKKAAGKRSSAGKKQTGAKQPTAAKRSAAKRGRAKRAAPKRATASPRAQAPRSRPEPTPAGGNPVEEAVRAAAKVAETGLKVASGVTREVLRRLPRP